MGRQFPKLLRVADLPGEPTPRLRGELKLM